VDDSLGQRGEVGITQAKASEEVVGNGGAPQVPGIHQGGTSDVVDGYRKMAAIAGGVLTQLLRMILVLDVGDVGNELL
jgi:hypothetical protein